MTESEEKISTSKSIHARNEHGQCSCVADPYADLPAELRPRPHPKIGGLRMTTCPNCGREFWSNRKTHICISCEPDRSGG
jgi:hypothetical protein